MATNKQNTYELSPTQRQNLSKNIVNCSCTKQWNPGITACYAEVSPPLMQELIGCRAQIVPTDILQRIAGVFGTTVPALLQTEPIHIEGSNSGLLIHAGEILRIWRNRMKLTQANLARKIGLSQAKVSLAERGYTSNHTEKIVEFLAPDDDARTVILKHIRDPLPFPLDKLRKRTRT